MRLLVFGSGIERKAQVNKIWKRALPLLVLISLLSVTIQLGAQTKGPLDQLETAVKKNSPKNKMAPSASVNLPQKSNKDMEGISVSGGVMMGTTN